MARIMARGDREVAREEIGGSTYVFTEKGRILYKWRPGASFIVYARGRTRTQFDETIRLARYGAQRPASVR